MIERGPTDEECLYHYHTFKKYVPKEFKKFKDYRNNLNIVREYITITDNTKNNEPLKLIFSDLNVSLGNIPKIPCVYILMLDNEARYIGQTSNLFRRINYGHLDKLFNRVLYIKCFDKRMRMDIENEIFGWCYPLYNHYRQM